jgi:hypothetical protein
MAKLDVSGAFFITIGMGSGPHTWVTLSANNDDGTPYRFPDEPEELPVSVFLALSPSMGAYIIPLDIVERRIDFSYPGFCGVRVEIREGFFGSESSSLDDFHPATLGIVVDTGAARGQALACSCGAAYPPG